MRLRCAGWQHTLKGAAQFDNTRQEIPIMPSPHTAILPTPVFDWDPVARPPIAGLRPYRLETFRLEPESGPVGGKFIVHNYGHGGAGITVSWGCALEVLDVLAKRGISQSDSIAVLGAGVMGLTVATVLRERNLPVTVYAKSFPPNTTSNVAGGQWAPSMINQNDGVRFDRILRRAFATHSAKGPPFGVSHRDNYTLTRAGNFESCPRDVIPAPRQFNHLPFAHLTMPGHAYATLLVEPPILLDKLSADLTASNVCMVHHEFQSLSQVSGMKETIIVNCTGLGSRQLCQDNKLHSVKGELVLLPPQGNLQYLFAGHHGYVFPRRDAVVIGGSEKFDDFSDTPDMATCRRILANMKGLFEGTAALMFAIDALPDWVMRSK